jgi:toxin ParE1/3/4
MAGGRPLHWSPSSRRDLFTIYRYFSSVASHEVAENILLEVDSATTRLKREPFMGVPRPDLLPELRAIFVQPYMVFYRPTDAAIEIVRVLHERQRLVSKMFEEAA